MAMFIRRVRMFIFRMALIRNRGEPAVQEVAGDDTTGIAFPLWP